MTPEEHRKARAAIAAALEAWRTERAREDEARSIVPAPRYDDVFWTGVAWLNGLAGDGDDERSDDDEDATWLHQGLNVWTWSVESNPNPTTPEVKNYWKRLVATHRHNGRRVIGPWAFHAWLAAEDVLPQMRGRIENTRTGLRFIPQSIEVAIDIERPLLEPPISLKTPHNGI